jgi:hypothetical protein
VKQPKTLSRHDLSDGRCIEQLEDEQGRLLYRACSDGGGICRYCEDLWMANMYADDLSWQRQLKPQPGLADAGAGPAR